MAKKMLTTFLVGTIFTFLTILGSGCAKKPKVPEIQEEVPPEVRQEEVTSKPHEGFKPAPTRKPKKPRRRVPADTRFEDIHFDYDKYEIKRDDKSKLKNIAGKLKKNPQLSVTIEGHCDERGTNAYNRALGEKRAGAAQRFLYSLGIAKSRITTVSYGEEKPVCMEQKESCWWKNRRAHSFATRGGN